MAPNVVDLPKISYNDIVKGNPAAAAELFKAASTDGFFQLDLKDGVAQADVLDVLPAVYKAGEEYFAQPAALKEQDRRNGDPTDRGYEFRHAVRPSHTIPALT
jgi:isopenicillin N synthase-like dioxygenase